MRQSECGVSAVGGVAVQRKVELLEGRCQKLQADTDAYADRMRAAEVRAADAQAALRRRTAPMPDTAASADRAAAAAVLRAAQREAATAAAAASAAEAREAAALAQVAALEEAAERHGLLVAQVAALQGRADDSAAEKSRSQHYQKVRMPHTLQAQIVLLQAVSSTLQSEWLGRHGAATALVSHCKTHQHRP